VEVSGDPALREVAPPVVLGEQLGRLRIGSRGSLELCEDGRLAIADLAVQVREQGELD
jgi:hypothetical protein